jgi:hypothetical protein
MMDQLNIWTVLIGLFVVVVVSGQDDGSCDVIKAMCPGLVENATKQYPSYKDLRTVGLYI